MRKVTDINRLYIANKLALNNDLTIINNYHYIANVLRKGIGSYIRIFNSTDGEYLSRIEVVHKKYLVLKPIEYIRDPLLSKPLIAALCLTKKDTFHSMFNTLTQLGITQFIPIISARSKNENINYEKLTKICKEAVEQSERFLIPEIHHALDIKSFLESNLSDFIICAMERDQSSIPIHSLISQYHNLNYFNSVSILIGPEGGFSDSEKTHLMSIENLKNVNIGQFILKSETAATIFASYANLILNIY